MRAKTLLLFFFFMGACVIAQPAQPLNLSEIKKVMGYSTDINKLVENVKSLNKGFEVIGEINQRGTRFTNGSYEFTVSCIFGEKLTYSEIINKSVEIRLSSLLDELRSDAFEEDPRSNGSTIVMKKKNWEYQQVADLKRNKARIRLTIVYPFSEL